MSAQKQGSSSTPAQESPSHEEFIRALDVMIQTLEKSNAANQASMKRVREIQHLVRAGHSVSEIVQAEEPPLIVELTRNNLERLYDAGGKLRRAEARLLHEEGLTMDAIARLFGVTRQRVSALINSAA